jgi:TetR/AcrR family transcriptional regulator
VQKEQQPNEQTEAKILEAARAVFLRSGMSGARMQEIADEAGVNKALLHYYFRSKEGLSRAVFHSAAGELLPRVFMLLGADVPLEQKVREVIAFELQFLSEHPYLPGYVASEIHYHPELVLEVFRARGAPPLDRLRAQLAAEAEAGRIRPIAVEQFMANLMSLLFFPFVARPALGFMLDLGTDGFAAFMEDRKAGLADFFLSGLRP